MLFSRTILTMDRDEERAVLEHLHTKVNISLEQNQGTNIEHTFKKIGFQSTEHTKESKENTLG